MTDRLIAWLLAALAAVLLCLILAQRCESADAIRRIQGERAAAAALLEARGEAIAKAERGRLAAEAKAAQRAAQAVEQATGEWRAKTAWIEADRRRLAAQLAAERKRLAALPAPEREAEARKLLGADVVCGTTPGGPGDPPHCILGASATEAALLAAREREAAPASCQLEVRGAIAGCELAAARRLAVAGEQAARQEARERARAVAFAAGEQIQAQRAAELEDAAHKRLGFWAGFGVGAAVGALGGGAAVIGVAGAIR